MSTMKVNTANDRQVGGDHYKTGGLEHWDLFGPEYLVGCATKYVARWRKKCGVQDLEKALHYAEKLSETVIGQQSSPGLQLADDLVESWIRNSSMDWVEQTIVHKLLHWNRVNIDEAIAGIRHLIASAPASLCDPSLVFARANKQLYDPVLGTVTLTNTPRAGETEAQTHARERRVPRYDGDTPSCGDGSFDARMRRAAGAEPAEPQIPRTPDDGAQHASLTPWVTTPEWIHDQQRIAPELADRFWSRRAAHVYVLEPHVVSDHMPRVLRPCYNLRGSDRWTLNVRACPPDARDYFPNLDREKNMMEWEKLPEWQRVLYTWSEDGSKYALTEFTSDWHAEAE